jgi:serine/threonine-protein kinase
MAVDAQLAELLSRWEQARERGEALTPEALCAECPGRLSEVRDQIDKLARMDRWLDTKGQTRTGDRTEVHVDSDIQAALAIESRYASVRFLDRGGLGIVCVGHDERLHRDVALKFIDDAHAAVPECLEQFLVEAEVTGRLEHPGVVPVYGLGRTSSGRPFYAMRFIEGETLDAAIERFHNSAEVESKELLRHQLLTRFISVCNTIGYAHNRGIVHRDIKPANVMLGRYGETLVVDWGLALPVGRDEKAKASGERTLLPQSAKRGSQSSSATAGTPPYMSPEQAAGEQPVGMASDVYSLGATLYKLLTGQPPYTGKTAHEILLAVPHGEFPRPRSLRSDVPAALEAICLKAMALKPADRYPSALALAKDVEHWLADEPVSVHPEFLIAQGGRWFRRHRAAALTAVLALLAISGILMLANVRSRQQTRSEHTARVEAERAQDRSLLLAAQFAARTVAGVVEAIQRTTEIEALDPDLRALLAEIDTAGSATAEHRARLQAWIDSRFIKHTDTTHAAAWFITDPRGTQLVRSPASGDTEGRSFATRDYFHGGGRELTAAEAAANPPAPIQRSHVSRAFRSKATGELMVAFATPVWSGAPQAAGSRVLGLLATTVQANRFDVLRLEAEGPKAEEMVVLVDLREDWLQSQPQRGLILHQQHSGQPQTGGVNANDLARVDPSIVDRLTTLWQHADRQSRSARPAGAAQPEELLMRSYVDPQGLEWTAALAAVPVSPASDAGDEDREDRRLRWGVLVQRRQGERASDSISE